MSLTLGATLRLHRYLQNKTLKQINAVSGMSTPYLSQLETGKVQQPSLKKLELLALAYDIPYDQLLILSGHTPSSTLAPTHDVPLPVFIIEAGEVLDTGDWEQVRPLVEQLLRGKADASPIAIYTPCE